MGSREHGVVATSRLGERTPRNNSRIEPLNRSTAFTPLQCEKSLRYRMLKRPECRASPAEGVVGREGFPCHGAGLAWRLRSADCPIAGPTFGPQRVTNEKPSERPLHPCRAQCALPIQRRLSVPSPRFMESPLFHFDCLRPMNHPKHNLAKTLGAFLLLLGVRAGFRLAHIQLPVHGKQKKAGPKPRLLKFEFCAYLAPAAVVTTFSSRSLTRVAPLPMRLRR